MSTKTAKAILYLIRGLTLGFIFTLCFSLGRGMKLDVVGWIFFPLSIACVVFCERNLTASVEALVRLNQRSPQPMLDTEIEWLKKTAWAHFDYAAEDDDVVEDDTNVVINLELARRESQRPENEPWPKNSSST